MKWVRLVDGALYGTMSEGGLYMLHEAGRYEALVDAADTPKFETLAEFRLFLRDWCALEEKQIMGAGGWDS